MHELVDVLIVGPGPGGLFLAARLAERGIRTLVCEEHSRVGDPVHCTGVLSADSFGRFDLPTVATLNQLADVRFVSPGGIAVDYRTPAPLATVIDRPAFDRALAVRAEAAGAQIRSGARVTSLAIDASGAQVSVGGGSIRARLVVLACGANYAFQRRFCFGPPRRPLHTAHRAPPPRLVRGGGLAFVRGAAAARFWWAVPAL